MSTPLLVVSGDQIRAARALLGWDQGHLAAAAGLSVPTVHRMEKLGPERCLLGNILKAQRALTAAGIVFIGPGERGNGGIGVQLRRDSGHG